MGVAVEGDLCGWLKLLGGISKEPGYGAKTQVVDDVMGNRLTSPPPAGYQGVVVGVATRRAWIMDMFEGGIQKCWTNRWSLDSNLCASLVKRCMPVSKEDLNKYMRLSWCLLQSIRVLSWDRKAKKYRYVH